MIDFVYNLHQVQKLDSGSPDQCPGQALPGMTNAQGIEEDEKKMVERPSFYKVSVLKKKRAEPGAEPP